jgi:hypothetical protein
VSYARFGWNGSDVYVFAHVAGLLECCACALDHGEFWESFQSSDTQTMIDHLKKHEESGHIVPKNIYKDLWDDDEENFGKL